MTRSSTQVALLLALAFTALCYNKLTANEMTHFSNVAYESQASIDAWNCKDCANYPVKSQKSFFSSTANIQGYAAYYPKSHAVIIAFRGSVDFKNWVYNLNTASTNFPGCSGCAVHAGFYSAWKGVSGLVQSEVTRLLGLYPGSKLIITGHSLGGAMAIHAALELKAAHAIDSVYTFGQPRVGNQNFATFYQSQVPNTFRVINFADMVPHVPPSAFNFKHGGVEIWYSPRGMQTYVQCASEDPKCANSVTGTALNTDDHSLSNYMMLATLTNYAQEIRGLRGHQEAAMTVEEVEQAEKRKFEIIQQVFGNQQQ